MNIHTTIKTNLNSSTEQVLVMNTLDGVNDNSSPLETVEKSFSLMAVELKVDDFIGLMEEDNPAAMIKDIFKNRFGLIPGFPRVDVALHQNRQWILLDIETAFGVLNATEKEYLKSFDVLRLKITVQCYEDNGLITFSADLERLGGGAQIHHVNLNYKVGVDEVTRHP